MSFKFPRMLVWLVLTIVLMGLALRLQAVDPGNLFAVTLYKAHLLALGGWGGYWLDRALFPYDRPHCYLQDDHNQPGDRAAWNPEPEPTTAEQTAVLVSANTFGSAMLRRAVIVAASLITVGMGA